MSRQRLLNDLKELTAAWEKYPVMTEQIKGVETAIGYVETIPSAQSERKTGKWEIYIISMLDGEGCKCSECGFEGAPYWDYCPNCGARMVKEDEEHD